MKSDGDKIEKMTKEWDSLLGSPLDTRLPTETNTNNIYDKRIESSEDTPQSKEDENLYTAFVLLSSHGLDSAIGKMMSAYAEETLPQTISSIFRAYEHAKASNTSGSHKFLYTLRGVLMFTYAWAYVMARTQTLTIRDQEFYPYLIKLASTAPNTAERKVLTQSAENKLETTLGALLHAIDSARKSGHNETVTFFEGNVLACYTLANMYFGQQAQYFPDAA